MYTYVYIYIWTMNVFVISTGVHANLPFELPKNHQIKQKTLWFKESIAVNEMERFLIRVCFEWLEPTRPFVA